MADNSKKEYTKLEMFLLGIGATVSIIAVMTLIGFTLGFFFPDWTKTDYREQQNCYGDQYNGYCE